MHRLFHTLVVCGAGLTLAHCGGKSSTDADDDADDSGGSAGTTASSGGTGAVSATGGTSTGGGSTSPGGRAGAAGGLGAGGVSTGGSTGTAGSASAGAAGAGGMGGVAPTGPSERWTCTNQGCFGAFTAPDGCTPDPDRPKEPAECGDGEMFACLAAWLNDGTQIRVNCECVPEPADDEACPCPSTTSCTADPPFDRGECANGESLCGCAITCILK